MYRQYLVFLTRCGGSGEVCGPRREKAAVTTAMLGFHLEYRLQLGHLQCRHFDMLCICRGHRAAHYRSSQMSAELLCQTVPVVIQYCACSNFPKAETGWRSQLQLHGLKSPSEICLTLHWVQLSPQ